MVFQKEHSTEHAILQLINQILESFKHDKFTIGVFIDLSKAFDTVNHSILLKKLSFYGIKITTLIGLIATSQTESSTLLQIKVTQIWRQ